MNVTVYEIGISAPIGTYPSPGTPEVGDKLLIGAVSYLVSYRCFDLDSNSLVLYVIKG